MCPCGLSLINLTSSTETERELEKRSTLRRSVQNELEKKTAGPQNPSWSMEFRLPPHPHPSLLRTDNRAYLTAPS